MDIQEFRSSFTNDLAKPSRFKVLINIPGALGTTMNSRTLSLRCENASIPGRTLATSDLRIYGPTEKYPYQSTYEDITLTFICDDNMMEKTAFDNWMEQINPKFSWNFDYKANYATRITIIQYDNADNEVHKIHLVDAFPVAVSQLDLDWASDAPYHKLSVVFAYTYWEVEGAPAVNPVLGSSINTPFSITPDIVNTGKELVSGTNYQAAFAAGDMRMIIPSQGGTQSISSVLNNAGQGALDTALDQGASKINADKQTISALTTATKIFTF